MTESPDTAEPTPAPPPKVLYACLATAQLPNGETAEIVPCLIVRAPNGQQQSLPMVAVGEAAGQARRQQAQQLADAMGKPLRVVSAPIEDVGTIEPNLITTSHSLVGVAPPVR